MRRAFVSASVAFTGAAGAVLAYCKPDAKQEWDADCDFLVIGAGSSGCALASRLAQNLPKSSTLLLEAGDHDNLACIQTARDYFGKVEKVFGYCFDVCFYLNEKISLNTSKPTLCRSDRDWSYGTETQKELLGRALYWPRGKVVGGCSSFNTMVRLAVSVLCLRVTDN